jgi:hypothetical protein
VRRMLEERRSGRGRQKITDNRTVGKVLPGKEAEGAPSALSELG